MSEINNEDNLFNPTQKSPTGIVGLDKVLSGGFPKGRTTVISGDSGTGKSLLAIEWLIKGSQIYGENGLYISFDVPVVQICQDLASIDWNLESLIKEEKVIFQYISVLDHEQVDRGEFSLDILVKRLESMIKKTGVTRIVLDSLESLLNVIQQKEIIRRELRSLFRWFSERNLTLVITVEHRKDDSNLNLANFMADCFINLEQCIVDQTCTRRIRILKYRGSAHGMNSYPYIISSSGNQVYPITSVNLDYDVSSQRIGLGIAELNEMLSGGVYEGSSVLISGTIGTGKTSFAGYIANEICNQGRKCLYLAFEESESQICRNLKSIGLDLKRWVEKGFLQFKAERPTSSSLEHHLLNIIKEIEIFNPSLVIVDPISNFLSSHENKDSLVKLFLMRLIDTFKSKNITSVFTSLIEGGMTLEGTPENISSVMDTWISLQLVEQNNERNRLLKIFKSRGSNHSNQLREYILCDEGIKMIDVYLGAEGLLTGTQRLVQQAKDKAEEQLLKDQITQIKEELEAQKLRFQSNLERFQLDYSVEEKALQQKLKSLQLQQQVVEFEKAKIFKQRDIGLIQQDKDE